MARSGRRCVRLGDQPVEQTPDFRQMAEYFGDPDHGQIPRVHHGVASRGSHAVPARSKDFERRVAAAERPDELRAVHFAGGLSGGDENSHPAIVKGPGSAKGARSLRIRPERILPEFLPNHQPFGLRIARRTAAKAWKVSPITGEALVHGMGGDGGIV